MSSGCSKNGAVLTVVGGMWEADSVSLSIAGSKFCLHGQMAISGAFLTIICEDV